ncbi:gluconokinase [Microbacterium esteraromaticum]|uniref:gluconokinase n=1 Tax=Microbacterium esteraromaticum TaxID=57043 RepID=UPI0019D3E3BC|nr:gluconokinase [Microbacterium esteraromaticum]MBN7793897.1 gluconokinase [Microbacterium esteraromaticum]MCA1307317.1 gluconokinase [Microbacterium esteraromaticum]
MSADDPVSTCAPVVIMGVSGVGKSTVGRRLADALQRPFLDADDLHPATNVAKMSAGTPLDDDDRWPWLDLVGDAIRENPRTIVACSALRRAYRDRLRERTSDLLFLHLTAPAQVLSARLSRRQGHFMAASMLQSQLDTLEQLVGDENGFTVAVDAAPATLVNRIHRMLVPLPAEDFHDQ